MIPVLDASLFVAAISPAEVHHVQARELYESHPEDMPFRVPSIFRVEVLAALSRRGESAELLDLVDAVVRGPRFVQSPLTPALLERAVGVAREARLRAYDAVYVALALDCESPIYSLDADLRARVEVAFPEVVVQGAS